ncbi:TetR/AcrR family transcriptional regulator [Stenotrophomonas pennii]|uniref:TetR/AcrR family transcriptional regulator n=1 Tax=Stenotrophomonas lacuserhaii TaxID=2760084 RepID=UPI003209B9F0
MSTSLSAAFDAGRGPAEHDVRTQIIEAATAHFSHFGYDKTTVSDLAKAIGFSKAYIYKFFASKQAIGEVICANCLAQIESEVHEALQGVQAAPDRLRVLFTAIVDASLRLFLHDRRLYEIAVAAATDRWPSTQAYQSRIRGLVEEILKEGRDAGAFERRTPLDQTSRAVYQVLVPYLNPVTLPHLSGLHEEAPTALQELVLRSLAP